MITFNPLRDLTKPGVPLLPPYGVLEDIGWLPLGETELLPTAHLLPLAVRLDGPRPTVGAVVAPAMLARRVLSAEGQWLLPFTPIALKCFPFRLSALLPSADPFADLEYAREQAPAPGKAPHIRVRHADGSATDDLKLIHGGLKTVWLSQQRLMPALDILLIADLLVPIAADDETAGPSPYFTIDRRRFVQSSNGALEAMTRNNFNVIDLVTALCYSQMHLRPALRPVAMPPAPAAGKAEPAPTPPAAVAEEPGLETIKAWLDTSELFPGTWAADAAI